MPFYCDLNIACHMFDSVQCAYCEWYQSGRFKPNYPVPAIPLAVKYDYVGCINIDDVSDPDDPIIVYMFDSWNMIEV